MEETVVSVATTRDGLLHVSALRGAFAFPAHARGALCCLSATIHQGNAEAGSPGWIARDGGVTGSQSCFYCSDAVCGVRKPLPRSSQDSRGFPECQHRWSAHFRQCSFRGSHWKPCNDRGTLRPLQSLTAILSLHNPISKMERWAERAGGFSGEEKQKKHSCSWQSSGHWDPLCNGSQDPSLHFWDHLFLY